VGVKKEAKKENLTDSNLKSLNLDEIKAVDHASDEFTNLERYCSETYKYGNYAQPFKLEEIFRIERFVSTGVSSTNPRVWLTR